MLKKIKKVAKSSLFYSVGLYTITNIVNAALPFLLMPILTRYLSPVDYGIVAIMQVLVGITTPFVGLNVHGAVRIKYFQKKPVEFSEFVSSCFVILSVTGIIMSLIFSIFNIQIANLAKFPENWLWTIVFICFGTQTIQILLVILQSSVQPKKYALIQILQTIMNFSITFFLVVMLYFNWQGRVIAQMITIAIFFVLSLIMLYKHGWLVWSCKKEYISDALRFGIPLIPHALGGFLMVMTDRIIIADLVGLSETGIYAVGAQIGAAIGILEYSFSMAYSPWLYDKLSKITSELKIKIVKFTYVYMIVLIIIAILFSLVVPWFLKYFISKEFYGAGNIVLWVSLGYAFNGMYKMVSYYIFYVEKTYILAWITFSSAILHIIITYYGVLYFGAIGAGYATTLTYFINFIMTWILSEKVYPMPWIGFCSKS